MLNTEQAAFLDTFEALYHKQEQKGSIGRLRKLAWERISHLGLPTRKNETFRYAPLNKLYSQKYALTVPSKTLRLEDIQQYILPECTESQLCFVDGVYSEELSNTQALPQNVLALPIEKASKKFAAFLNTTWKKEVESEKNPFVLLNVALHKQGLFVYIPPKSVIETPIQVLYISTEGDYAQPHFPLVHFFVGAQSECTVYTHHLPANGPAHWSNSMTKFSIEEEAKVQHFKVQNKETPQWSFDHVYAQLKRNSSFKSIDCTFGALMNYQDYHITLTGEGSEVTLEGLWLLDSNKQKHTNIYIEHQAENCYSRQLFKGVLDDLSRSSFTGKIYVHKEAQQTNAFQLNNNLLLSDKAFASAMPNLEIFADDVKASHGATFGQLEADQLFYLRSRGISESSAKRLLICGFVKEIIAHIPSFTLREQILNGIYAR